MNTHFLQTGTIVSHGIIHIQRQQTSKEKISVANVISQYQQTLGPIHIKRLQS